MEQSRQISSKFRMSEEYFQKRYRKIYMTHNNCLNTYNCLNTKSIKFLLRFRLGLSHLRNHKFKHGILDSLNPICSCGLDIETTCYYLLNCPFSKITKSKFPSNDASVIKRFLHDDDSLDSLTNTLILNAFVDFILSSKRFDGPLL